MRRRRRLIRRIGFGSLLSVLLIAFLLAANSIEVSPRETATVPSPPRLATRPRLEPTQPLVPVPLFRPSILLDALETEVPEVESLDLELREIEGSLVRMRPAASQEQLAFAQPSVPRHVRAELIHLSALDLHLLETIEPRPQVDPPRMDAIPELLEPPTAADRQAGSISDESVSRSMPSPR